MVSNHCPALSSVWWHSSKQNAFADLLGVSLHTVQDWEQGRRQPTGAAQTLLRVAAQHPEALRDLHA